MACCFIVDQMARVQTEIDHLQNSINRYMTHPNFDMLNPTFVIWNQQMTILLQRRDRLEQAINLPECMP